MKLLDCTLRDGGYYTDWDFSRELTQVYLAAFNQLPVDVLEVGYRSRPMKDYLGQYFYCPDYVLAEVRRLSNKQLAIILNEKDVRSADVPDLLTSCQGIIDLVRIAVAPENFVRALGLGEAIKKLGFEVSFNVMYMSTWQENRQFLEEMGKIDGLLDYFYLVDSYGGVYPEDVKATIALVREKTDCALGFHGHNNLELGLINTLTALEHGVEIVDATITGMGRGAGNLKMELLLTALNARIGLPVDFNTLSQVVTAFEVLQQHYGWGTNLPYMVSGANSLPQKQVMEWVTQRFYSFNAIIQALQNEKEGVADNRKLPVFESEKTYHQVVIIGGGPSAVEHAPAVKALLAARPELAIIHASSKNAKYYDALTNPQFFCLVGNEGYRLEKVFADLTHLEGQCILPPYPRKMGTYIPSQVTEKSYELPTITFSDRLWDSHTALALQTAQLLGARDIFLVGYDGYLDGAISQKERKLTEENEYLFSVFKEATGVKLRSLTPTHYKQLVVESVYAHLI